MPNEVLNVKDPITREELALFASILAGGSSTSITPQNQNNTIEAVEKIVSILNTKFDAIDSSVRKLNETNLLINETMNKLIETLSGIPTSIDHSSDMLRKQIYAVMTKIDTAQQVPTVVQQPDTSPEPKNKLFYSTLSKSEQKFWVEKSNGIIANLCLKGENKGNLYAQIYSDMKADGYNVPELLKEYHTINAKAGSLEMFAASDGMRKSFEKVINRRVHDKAVGQYKKEIISLKNNIKTVAKKSRSAEALCCPLDVKQIISKLEPSGKINSGTYAKAYKLLNIDRDAFIERTKKRIGYKNVSLGYAISLDTTMFIKLEEAIDEYLKQNRKEST